jgi:hypothetical protein
VLYLKHREPKIYYWNELRVQNQRLSNCRECVLICCYLRPSSSLFRERLSWSFTGRRITIPWRTVVADQRSAWRHRVREVGEHTNIRTSHSGFSGHSLSRRRLPVSIGRVS